MLLFLDEARVDEPLDFILNCIHYFRVKPLLLLFVKFQLRLDIELMHGRLRVETQQFFVATCEDVYVLLNKLLQVILLGRR